jgi:hypothetical protein
MIRTLQGGLDLAGFELKGAPEFTDGMRHRAGGG